MRVVVSVCQQSIIYLSALFRQLFVREGPWIEVEIMQEKINHCILNFENWSLSKYHLIHFAWWANMHHFLSVCLGLWNLHSGK